MNKYAVFTLSLVLTVLAQLSFAQNYKIHGTVSDESGQPVPFASVYVNATSYGTSTNEEGFYELSIPKNLGKVELIASLVGYESKKTTVEIQGQFNKELNITLKGIILDEAIVQGKIDRFWKKKWKVFRNGLLGEVSPNRNYVFPNRDMIKLSYDEDKKAVLAEASEPFYVINETLGYKIKVDLQYFRSDNLFTNLSIYKYFQENLSEEPDERAKQLENREKAYFQTMRHFLVSLKDGRVDENNYDIYKIIKMNQTFLGRTTLMEEVSEGRLVSVSQKDIYAYDSKSGKHFLHTNQPLLIFNKNYASYQNNPFRDYYYEFSKIELPNFLVEFNENGYITRSNGLTLHNRWSREGLGRQLPANYRPDGYEKDSAPTEKQLQSMDISVITAKQMKLDSMVLRGPDRLDQAVTTSNILIEKDDEPDYFYEPDVTYKLAARDANQSIFQILKRVPSLRVMMNNNTGEYDIYLQGGNTSLTSDGGDKTPNLVINNRVYRTRSEVMDQLLAIDTRQVKEVGLIKYGGGAIFGATGGHGTIVILMDNYRNVH